MHVEDSVPASTTREKLRSLSDVNQLLPASVDEVERSKTAWTAEIAELYARSIALSKKKRHKYYLCFTMTFLICLVP